MMPQFGFSSTKIDDRAKIFPMLRS